jgi:hypothetical protein
LYYFHNVQNIHKLIKILMRREERRGRKCGVEGFGGGGSLRNIVSILNR